MPWRRIKPLFKLPDIFVLNLATHAVTAHNLGLPPISGLQAIGVNSVIAHCGPRHLSIPVSNPVTVAAAAGVWTSGQRFTRSRNPTRCRLACAGLVKNLYVAAGTRPLSDQSRQRQHYWSISVREATSARGPSLSRRQHLPPRSRAKLTVHLRNKSSHSSQHDIRAPGGSGTGR